MTMIAKALALSCTLFVMPASQAQTAFNGRWIEGSMAAGGAADWLELLDTARGQFSSIPALQSTPMLYQPTNNNMVEGPTWNAWWTTNSYGATFSSLPFLGQPGTTWVQNSQNFWFDHIGNGTRKDPHGDIGPDGALCDDGGPTYCRFKQGDGNVPLHDWTLEETLSAVVMQAELLLVTRNTTALVSHWLPLFLRTLNLIETRRDTTMDLFLSGPSSNLMAPSFGGWLLPNGKRAHAYLAGLSVTYIVALDRVIELERLAGRQYYVDVYTARRESARAGLFAHLIAPGTRDYLVKSMDQDGTLHGVMGAPQHGYIEAVSNHDAAAFRAVTNDSMAEAIVARMMAVPGLRPHNFTITNAPSLDDMIYNASTSGWLWQFGTWVNGGAWSSCEARMMLAYMRTGRAAQAFTSMRQMMGFANQWRMDNPLPDFGAQVYQPKEPINLVIDNFGVPGALLRGLFEPLYGFDSLTFIPHVPAAITALRLRFPFVWGDYRMHFSTTGDGSSSTITAVTVNGAAAGWGSFNASAIVLQWAGMPPLVPPPFAGAGTTTHVNISITFGKGSASLGVPSARAPAASPARPSSFATPLNCTLPAAVQARVSNLTGFVARMAKAGFSAERYEVAHAMMVLEFATWTWPQRCAGINNGTIARLSSPTSQAAADAMVMSTISKLDAGLTAVIARYAAAAPSDPLKGKIWALWTSAGRVPAPDTR